MLHNPFKIVEMFEEEVSYYTGAKYAVAVDNCTNAIFLCCKYLNVMDVVIPKKTYISVPQAIEHAGGKIHFENTNWSGIYQLKPYAIYDASKRFTSGMFIKNSFMCLSFHTKKHLKIGKGGMILLDDKDAYEKLKKMRYEGRTGLPYIEEEIDCDGYNNYMTPEQAARGLMLMQNIPENNNDLQEDYPDLTKFKLYEKR